MIILVEIPICLAFGFFYGKIFVVICFILVFAIKHLALR